MSGTRKNIPDQERTPREDLVDELDISVDDILNELQSFIAPPVQPGDVTTRMIMERMSTPGKRITKHRAYAIMEKAVATGKYIKVPVIEDGRRVVALRKK
jgi:hypothetical protein